ncbi:uncharacterized protein LOC135486956 [Lineus longissimus]|uniref:uncharacterized protein LOC135486956 n=1 Tax=Lineus longissimus TaxID=88925 RepID=UPI002B4DE201
MSDLDLSPSPMSWGDMKNLNNNINEVISSLNCEAGPAAEEDENDKLPMTQPIDQRILKDVVVFVDVRTGADNRSAAVALQLEKLGAQVEKKLTKNVTHIVFKDGRKNTIQIALKRKLKLVTVLWVDSCRQNQEHVSEGLFPVAASGQNLTPMFGRLKKMKSMQPKDFEEELRNSAGRAQRTIKRRENKMKKLAWRNLFTDDSQPDEEVIPFISTRIPATPPFMLAKCEQLRRERAEREALAKNSGMDSIDESDYSETKSEANFQLSLDPSPDVEYDINLSVGDSPQTEPHSSPEDIFSQDEWRSQSPVNQVAASSQDEEKKKGPSKKKRKLFTSQEVGDPASFLITPKKRMETTVDTKNSTRPGVLRHEIETPGRNVSVSELGRQLLLRGCLNNAETPVLPVAEHKGRKRKRTVSVELAKAAFGSQGKGSAVSAAKTVGDVSSKGRRKSAVKVCQSGQVSADTDPVSENETSAETANTAPTKTGRRKSVLCRKSAEIHGEVAASEVQRGSRRKSVMFPVEVCNDSESVEKSSGSQEQVTRPRGKSAIGTGTADPMSVVASVEKTRGARRKSTIGTVGDRVELIGLSLDTAVNSKKSRRKSATVASQNEVTVEPNVRRGRQKSSIGTAVKNVTVDSVSEIDEQVKLGVQIKKSRRKSTIGGWGNVEMIDSSRIGDLGELGEPMKKGRRKPTIRAGENVAIPDNSNICELTESGVKNKKTRRKSTVGAGGPKDDKATGVDMEKTMRGRRTSTMMTKDINTELSSAGTEEGSTMPSGRGRRKSVRLTPKESVAPVQAAETPSNVEKPRNKRLSVLSATKTKVSGSRSRLGWKTSDSSSGGEGNSSGRKGSNSRMSIEEFNMSPTVHRAFKGGIRNARKVPSGSISTAYGDDSSDPEHWESITSVAEQPGKGKDVGKAVGKNVSLGKKRTGTNANTGRSKPIESGVENRLDTWNVQKGSKQAADNTNRQNRSLPAITQKNRKMPAGTSDAKLTGRKIVKRAKSCSSLPKSPLPASLYSDVLQSRKVSATTRHLPSIVTTSLHFGEQDVIQSIIENLGGFRLTEKVDRTTTHVICGKNRRTLNILHAITSGCWILSPEWAYKSLDFDGWIEEEPYQLTEFFPACQITRLQKFVEGPKYHLDFFKEVGTVYVGDGCAPPAAALIDLLKSCGGKVTTSIRSAEVVVGKSRKNVPSVSEKWILDSITSLKCQPLDEYFLNVSDVSLNGANNSKEW